MASHDSQMPCDTVPAASSSRSRSSERKLRHSGSEGKGLYWTMSAAVRGQILRLEKSNAQIPTIFWNGVSSA